MQQAVREAIHEAMHGAANQQQIPGSEQIPDVTPPGSEQIPGSEPIPDVTPPASEQIPGSQQIPDVTPPGVTYVHDESGQVFVFAPGIITAKKGLVAGGSAHRRLVMREAIPLEGSGFVRVPRSPSGYKLVYVAREWAKKEVRRIVGCIRFLKNNVKYGPYVVLVEADVAARLKNTGVPAKKLKAWRTRLVEAVQRQQFVNITFLNDQALVESRPAVVPISSLEMRDVLPPGVQPCAEPYTHVRVEVCDASTKVLNYALTGRVRDIKRYIRAVDKMPPVPAEYGDFGDAAGASALTATLTTGSA